MFRQRASPAVHHTFRYSCCEDGGILHSLHVGTKHVVYSRDDYDGVIDIASVDFLKKLAAKHGVVCTNRTIYIVRTVRAQTYVLAIGTEQQFANHTYRLVRNERKP